MSSMSKFGRSMLEKYGWSEGKGLGREEDGIANAIKVNGNFSGFGLGHDVGKEFKNQWWDHVYNKTASNMRVAKSEDGTVKVERKEEQDSKKVIPYASAKSSQYSSFVKAGVLENVAEEEDMSLKLSYDELFKICGGKTAHKGARHGLTMTAKLARVKQQEEDLMAKLRELGDKNSPEAVKVSGEKIKKSKRKETSKACSDEHSLLHKSINGCTENTDLEQYSRKHKKEKKKKRDNTEDDTGIDDKDFPSSAVNVDCEGETMKSKLSKKERKLLAKANGGDPVRNENEGEKKKKKKKYTESENDSDANGKPFSDEPTGSILCIGEARCELNEDSIVTKLIGELETERNDINREGNVVKKNSKEKKHNCENDLNVTDTTSNIQCDEASELRLSKKERKRLSKLNKLIETERPVNSNTENEVEIKPKKKKKKSHHKEKESNFEHVDKENDEVDDIVLDEHVLKKEHKSRKRQRTEIVVGVDSSKSNQLEDGSLVVSDELGNESFRRKKKKCKRERQEK